MPELPEVESYARTFARHALHRTIARVRVLDERVLAVRPRELRALAGRQFTGVRRHGKHLFAHVGRVLNPSIARDGLENLSHIGDVWLRLHFGMTGDLTTEEDRFARVVFDFDDGTLLAFDDMRLFGVVAIKPLLLSQALIAGVGNLYADETLYRSGIHPRRGTDRLSDDDIKSMFGNLRRVLREAIAGRRRIFLIDHREEGERCGQCGGTIQRAIVGGRTTYFCGRHQR